MQIKYSNPKSKFVEGIKSIEVNPSLSEKDWEVPK